MSCRLWAGGKAPVLPEKQASCVARRLHLAPSLRAAGTSGEAPHFPIARQEASNAMNRISGTLAVLAGVFLLLPGVFAMLHSASSAVSMPGWLIRDLALSSVTGAALLFWGGSHIRHRELELYDLEPVRVRARR
jgi:hypothetical protein